MWSSYGVDASNTHADMDLYSKSENVKLTCQELTIRSAQTSTARHEFSVSLLFIVCGNYET